MKQVKLHFAGSQYGPFEYMCQADGTENCEIADIVHKLVNLGPQALQDAPGFSVALPKLSSPHFVVVVVQSSAVEVESTSKENAESPSPEDDVYIVEMKDEEEATALQLDGIANHLRNVYGANVFDKDTLRVHNGAHNKGSANCRVLVATRTRRQQSIKPPANQPVVKPSEESPPLSPMTRNGPLAVSFVGPVAIELPTQAKQPLQDTRLSTLQSFSSQRGGDESLDSYNRASSPFRGGVQAEKTATDMMATVESEDSQQSESQVPQEGEVDIDKGNGEEADNSVSPGQQDHDESYVQHQVHLLEHVCNGQCFMKDKCKKVPTKESLREMEEVISAHKKGELDDEANQKLKRYIIAHCQRCNDSECKILHSAAGCLPPGQMSSTEGREDSSASSEGELVDAVHLLEHAYNGKCNKMVKCQQPPSAGDLLEMITRYDEGRLDLNSTTGKLFKSYIFKHCQRCNDASCKVPHMAAGCHKPGMPLVEKVSGATKQPSRKELLMEKVHALEHVYNGKCIIQKCKKPPSSVMRAIERMKQAYEEGKLNSQLSKQLKHIVYAHCLRCSDEDCNVPHMMAGCQHPRVPQHLDPWVYGFTDGKKEIAQPTEKDGSSVAYPYYLKPKPVSDVSSADQEAEICEVTDSHTNESKQESQEWVMQNGCFPKSDILQQHSELRGQQRLLYCSQKLTEMTGRTFGSSIAEVDMTRNRLGRGGNGSVYECVVSGQKFASKQTLYRQKELTIWSGLDHINVTPLLGVITSASRLLGYTRSIPIYQLMPCMTGDFQKEVNCFGTLLSLIQSQKNPTIAARILWNTYHVFREAAAGIDYMHGEQLVHGDLKASNILIWRPPACHCAHVLLCTCGYRVFVSDFDSIEYQPDQNKTSIKDRIVVLHPGTLFYRAPEAHTNIVGPWCDMWSVGCTLARLILGRVSAEVKMKRYGIEKPKDVYKYHDIPHFVMSLETSDAREMLVSLCSAGSDAAISRLIEVVDGCFDLDYRRRITAKALHDKFSSCMKLQL